MNHDYFIGDTVEIFKVRNILKASNIEIKDQEFILDVIQNISNNADVMGNFLKRMEVFYKDLNVELKITKNNI